MSTRKHTPTDSPTETPTAVADPPADEPKPEGQSFADRVGQKKWTAAPDPFGIANDTLAGVRLFLSKQDDQMAIKFGDGTTATKPSQAVIDAMKEAGYRWHPTDRIWGHPGTARSDQIEAEKLYQKVRQMIRQEKGIEATKDIPF